MASLPGIACFAVLDTVDIVAFFQVTTTPVKEILYHEL
jgi:hypothetical protein